MSPEQQRLEAEAEKAAREDSGVYDHEGDPFAAALLVGFALLTMAALTVIGMLIMKGVRG